VGIEKTGTILVCGQTVSGQRPTALFTFSKEVKKRRHAEWGKRRSEDLYLKVRSRRVESTKATRQCRGVLEARALKARGEKGTAEKPEEPTIKKADDRSKDALSEGVSQLNTGVMNACK